MFAVIRSGGKQYRVCPEDIVTVEKLAGEAGEIVEFGDVLMVGEGDKATVGTPLVKGATVTGEVIAQDRGPKLISFKKRRRKNSQRTRGHRQWLTTVRIAEILTDGARPSRKAAARKAPARDDQPAAGRAGGAKKPAKEPAEVAPAAAKAATGKEDKPAGNKAEAKLFTAPKGKGDDLTKVKGIGPVARKQLNEQGITTFAQLARLTDADIARIDEAMPFSAGQVADWRDQAKALAS